MNSEDKPQKPADAPRREKQTMTEPQEEFVADQAQPSQPMSHEEDEPSDEKPAGHQSHKEMLEPGVEG